MKFTSQSVTARKEILANDHYVGVPYNCSGLSSLATNGIIKAGTIIPANDETAVGVLLSDVDLNSNPNGTIVIHGFIRSTKLPTTPAETALAALSNIIFLDENGTLRG